MINCSECRLHKLLWETSRAADTLESKYWTQADFDKLRKSTREHITNVYVGNWNKNFFHNTSKVKPT